jgi:catechol 2,3-dioxygenase-like lactoylglutathione lyase family enzyme
MKISTAQLWVHDQEEALAFYTEKLGFEVRSDVTLSEMDNFRWLTVGPRGQEDVAIVLMAIPGPPVMGEKTTRQVEELMAKGFAGTVFLTTEGARCRVHRGARRASLRDRLRLSRSLREQLPPHPGEATRGRLSGSHRRDGRYWARTSDLQLVELALSQLS